MSCKELLFLEPVFKEVVWGGTRLRDQFGYDVTGDHVGECWGISAHPNGDCIIKNGSFSGMHLSTLYKEHPELFGNCKADQYPLLVKIIDATDKLSIQVHPDDAYAGEHENGSLGKTECWYVLDAPKGAELVIGHNASTKEELDAMIDENRFSDLIRRIPVSKGDFVQIEPGTVHAITEGLLILETQQSSDITYRVYDYDRQPPRPLHVKQSKAVIKIPGNLDNTLQHTDCSTTDSLIELVDCAFYTVWKLQVEDSFTMEQKYPFLQISVVEGNGVINGVAVSKGAHLIIPAGYGKVEFKGEMEVILSTTK